MACRQYWRCYQCFDQGDDEYEFPQCELSHPDDRMGPPKSGQCPWSKDKTAVWDFVGWC
jgi:hypothetical protein